MLKWWFLNYLRGELIEYKIRSLIFLDIPSLVICTTFIFYLCLIIIQFCMHENMPTVLMRSYSHNSEAYFFIIMVC